MQATQPTTDDASDFDAIQICTLRTDKAFLKVIKKQSKDLELLGKKFSKERALVYRLHSSAVDKVMCENEKEKSQLEKKLSNKKLLVLCHSVLFPFEVFQRDVMVDEVTAFVTTSQLTFISLPAFLFPAPTSQSPPPINHQPSQINTHPHP